MILYDLLVQGSKKNPNKIAIVCEKGEITYSKLLIEVDLMHERLKKMNIRNDIVIGLILHNSLLFIVMLFALNKNKNLVCLINPDLYYVDVIKICVNANVGLAFSENYINITNVNDDGIVFIKRKDFFVDDLEFNLQNSKILGKQKGNYELIQCSSGTTGEHKLVYRSKENIKNDINNIVSDLNYGDNEKIFCCTPMNHGYGLTMGLLAGIYSNSTIITYRYFSINSFVNNYQKYIFTIIIGTPEIYSLITNSSLTDQLDFYSCKWLFCSSEPLNSCTAKDFKKKFGVWLNQVYGMMEASTVSVNKFPNEYNYLSIGQPLCNISMDYYNYNGKKCIKVKGLNVSEEYAYPNSTKVLVNNWLYTKDIITIDSNNNIYLNGRS